jgi:very-short-patch-repair endonuclease
MLKRSAHARGIVVLRDAIGLLDSRSASRPESHLRVAARLAGVSSFHVNEPIHRDDGSWLATPDLSLPAAKLALEYQGADHANVTRMRKDITRERDMRLEGWRVLYFGPAEVFKRPWSVTDEIRAEVRQRAGHLLEAPLMVVPRMQKDPRTPIRRPQSGSHTC